MLASRPAKPERQGVCARRLRDVVTTLPFDPSTSSAHTPAVGQRLTDGDTWVELYARAQLPTRFGAFEILVFRNNRDNLEHVALVRGRVQGAQQVTTRVHSACLTGDVLGSLRCDCRDQLELALETLAAADTGVLLYMHQEGRGIGLGNKIRAYALQEGGLDTVEANLHLGFDDDLRDYHVAALMLRMLGVQSVQLATNNPRKIFALKAHGVDVCGRLPLVTRQNPHNAGYLVTKARKAGHILPL
jgi:GTP cyclohydrolase II